MVPVAVRPMGAGEAREPSCPRHLWGLWIAGRWPPSRYRLRGRLPVAPAVRRRGHGGYPHPRDACRRPRPPHSGARGPGADHPWGSQWGQQDGPESRVVRRDGRAGRVLRHPFRVLSSGTLAPCERVSPRFRRPWWAPPGVSVATWLILPVVICLSQRLSHACLSISNLYCETANGSLNQLSFI